MPPLPPPGLPGGEDAGPSACLGKPLRLTAPRDENGNLGRGDGARVEIALAVVAALGDEARFLPGGFDALRDDLDLEAVAQIDDGPDDRGRVWVMAEVPHEAAVDLQEVDGKLLEVRQRGVAGPEIVERDRHARGAEQLQRPLDAIGAAAEEDRLSHFELQAVRRDAAF